MDTRAPDLIGTAEAAKILRLTPRQVLRIAPSVGRAWSGKTAPALYDRAVIERLAKARRK